VAYLFVLVLVAHLAALVEGATSIYGAPGLQLFALCCCGLVDAASAMPAGVGWAGAAAGAGIASEAIIGAVGSRALRSSVVQSGAKATTGQRLSVDKLYPSLNTEPSAVRTRTAANDQGTNQRRWEKGAANQPGRSIARSHDIVTELKPEVIASSHSHSNAIDIHTVTVGTHVIVDQRVAMGWEGGPAIVTKAYQPEKNKECAHICVKINGKGRQLKVREDTATFPARRNGRLAAVPKRKGAPEPSPKASKASGASFASPRTASCDSKVPSTASKTPADQSEWPIDSESGETDDSADESEPAESEDIDDELEFNFDVNPLADSNLTLRVRVTPGPHAEEGDMESRSQEMLFAILCHLGPKLSEVHKALGDSSTGTRDANRAGLNWAWSRKGFGDVMRRVCPESKKKEAGGKHNFGPAACKHWAKLIAAAKSKSKRLKLKSRFVIKITRFTPSTSNDKKNKRKRVIRGAASEQRDAQYDAMMESAVYSLGDFTSYNAYGRCRENMLNSLPKGQTRRGLKRSASGFAVTAGPTLAKVKAERQRRIKQLGIAADLLIVEDAAGAISLCTRDQLPEGSTRIGVVHDIQSWLSLVIRVMAADGECRLDLSKPGGGCLGTFRDTYLICWGDGFPAASRAAGNMCWTLVDPTHKLFPSGRSRPIPAALWHGHEDILINLLEQMGAAELGCSDVKRVEFKPFGTWIDVALPLRGFSADHKMWGELTGTISSGGHHRLHWLQPWTSIFFANDVETFVDRNLADSLVWRLRTLHNGMRELVNYRNDPNNFTVEKLKAWLESHKLPTTGQKSALVKRVTEAKELSTGAPLWGMTWKSVLADRAKTDRWVPETKVLSILSACNSATGVINFPVLAADNAHAFSIMEEVAAQLLTQTDEATPSDRSRKYLAALLDLDHISGTKIRKEKKPGGQVATVSTSSRRSLRFRSSSLASWLEHGAPATATGYDLKHFQNFLGIDHDAKYMGQKFVQSVILHNKSATKRRALKLDDAESIAHIETSMLRQMNIGCFKNFCYGWHYERLFYSVLDTFAYCAPSIILLALFIAQSNLWRRKRSRPSGDTRRPELTCKVMADSTGQLKVTPEETFGNDNVEIAKAHAVELCIPTLFGVLSEVSTLSMYFASHRWAPFMAALRLVIAVADWGEFRGEQANKHPKETARLTGNHWNYQTMERSSEGQVMKWMRKFTRAGPLDTELNGAAVPVPARSHPRSHGQDENPLRNSAVICPCLCHCTFCCNDCRRDDHGAFGAVANDDLRTVDEDDDPVGGETPIVDGAPPAAPATVEYATVKFDDLQPDMYIEVKWDREWMPAFVESLNQDEVKLLYEGPPVERDVDTQAEFDSTRNEARRIVGGRTPPVAPWVTEIPVEDFSLTLTAEDNGSTHAAANRRLTYDSGNRVLGGKALARTVPEQVRRNLGCTIKSIETQLGAEYVIKCGECYVIGAAAISQRLLREVRSQLDQTNSSTTEGDGSSSDGEHSTVGVVGSLQSQWQTTLPVGWYLVRVAGGVTGLGGGDGAGGPSTLLIKVTGTDAVPGCDRNKQRRRRATPKSFQPGTEYACHVVEVGAAAWEQYSQQNDQACIDVRTNGATPLLACVCDIAENAHCPGSTTDISLIPQVLRDMEVLPPTSANWKIEQRRMLHSIVTDCIQYQYRRHLLPTDQHQRERSTPQAAVTAESVYEALEKHGGKEWLGQQFGDNEELTIKRLGSALVNWLQDEVDGKRSRRQQSTLERDLKKKWQADFPAAIFFRGQLVHARYTKADGSLDTVQNATDRTNQGFEGRIVAEGETGFWRVTFRGEKDHPGIPHTNPSRTVCIFPQEL